MKKQALFSSKDISKELKCRLLQFLFGALRRLTFLSLSFGGRHIDFQLLFVCPFVHLAHLCPLYNSRTVWDIFIKLGTNMKHHNAMCRK